MLFGLDIALLLGLGVNTSSCKERQQQKYVNHFQDQCHATSIFLTTSIPKYNLPIDSCKDCPKTSAKLIITCTAKVARTVEVVQWTDLEVGHHF